MSAQEPDLLFLIESPSIPKNILIKVAIMVGDGGKLYKHIRPLFTTTALDEIYNFRNFSPNPFPIPSLPGWIPSACWGSPHISSGRERGDFEGQGAPRDGR